MEERKPKNRLGHEVALEAGSEAIQLHRPLSSRAQFPLARDKFFISGDVVQKSIAVMVRDKDPENGSKISAISSMVSDLDGQTALIDDDAWAGICFKKIVKE